MQSFNIAACAASRRCRRAARPFSSSHTIRTLCTRAILFNAGRVETEGKPSDVLNRYQKIIMSRQANYEAARIVAAEADEVGELQLLEEDFKPLSYTFRHGDGTAEILS